MNKIVIFLKLAKKKGGGAYKKHLVLLIALKCFCVRFFNFEDTQILTLPFLTSQHQNKISLIKKSLVYQFWIVH